jgi:UDP-glucose 4-epimerase
MKILVTGALGFVGSNLVDMLVSQGHEVYGIDNLSSESSSLTYQNELAEYILGDVQNVVKHYGDKKFDKIFHLAALARIQPSFEKPLEYFDANTLGTAAVCELARISNASLVYATTSSKNHGTPYLTPYTFSKVAGEGIVKTYAECFGMNTAMATFYNVYGYREPRKGEWATVVAKFGRQYLEGEKMTIVGDGSQCRDFTHVEDICKGLIKISEGQWKGDNFDLGKGEPISILNVAKAWADNDNSKFAFVPLRKNEGMYTEADADKTFAELGWRAEHSLLDYIQEVKHSYNISNGKYV